MDELFSTEPIRGVAKRGSKTFPTRRPRGQAPWPPPDRDPTDVALLADPYMFRFLLLFAESNRPLRIAHVAELLGVATSTASRTAKAAQVAALVDKGDSFVDRRNVTVRLTPLGEAAVSRCIDALRPHAIAVFGHPAEHDIEAAHALVGPPLHHTPAQALGGWRAALRAGWDGPDD